MQTTTPHTPPADELERRIVAMYRDVAQGGLGGQLHFPTGRPLALKLGYPARLLSRIPSAAVNSFAGVGHHFSLARLKPGERVLDLGSGSGMDAFAAALYVGPAGFVAGVDITPEQLARADSLRRPSDRVLFRDARIEELPFDDDSFDVVISNGAINLSARKRDVFAEAARVLRPGGRLALSDIVTARPIAARTAEQPDLWAACIAGASEQDDYLADVLAAGFELQVVRPNPAYRFTSERAQRTSARYGAQSVSLLARKPTHHQMAEEVTR